MKISLQSEQSPQCCCVCIWSVVRLVTIVYFTVVWNAFNRQNVKELSKPSKLCSSNSQKIKAAGACFLNKVQHVLPAKNWSASSSSTTFAGIKSEDLSYTYNILQ